MEHSPYQLLRWLVEKIYALDFEPEIIRTVERKAIEFNLNNVFSVLRDFMLEGSGLKDSSVDFVFLFNILHAKDPRRSAKGSL